MSQKYIIELLKIKDVEIIGSTADENIKYKSDIDLQEFIYHNEKKKLILDLFKDKFKEAKQNDNIFITDFKAGYRTAGEPLRWSYDDIMRGYQYVDGVKYTFISQLKKKSIIKMDIIALINGQFVEFSNNYYFIFNKKYKTKPNKDDFLASIIIDSIQLQKDNELMKSLKRIYSFLKILEVDNNDINKLIALFNSKIGHMSKQISDLKMIKTIYNNKFRKPKNDDIFYNIKLIQKELSPNYKHFINPLYKATDDNFNSVIDSVIDNLTNIVNTKIVKYVKAKNINISPIYYYNRYKFYKPNLK